MQCMLGEVSLTIYIVMLVQFIKASKIETIIHPRVPSARIVATLHVPIHFQFHYTYNLFLSHIAREG